MRRAVVLLVMLCAAATPAAAEKKRKTAIALTATGVGVSSGLVVASFFINGGDTRGEVHRPTFYAGLGTSIVTPSLGQWYAGKYLTVGMAVRAGGALLAAYGSSLKQDKRCGDGPDPDRNCPQISGNGYTVLSIAAIAYIGGMAYDVIDTPDAVAEHNRTHVMLTPTAGPHTAGLALVGSF